MKNVTCESFDNAIEMNATLSTSGAMTIFVEVLDEINNVFGQAEVFIDSGTGRYDFEVLNRLVDFCQFFRNKRYEPLLQIFYKIFVENGSWPKSCPIRRVS